MLNAFRFYSKTAYAHSFHGLYAEALKNRSKLTHIVWRLSRKEHNFDHKPSKCEYMRTWNIPEDPSIDTLDVLTVNELYDEYQKTRKNLSTFLDRLRMHHDVMQIENQRLFSELKETCKLFPEKPRDRKNDKLKPTFY